MGWFDDSGAEGSSSLQDYFNSALSVGDGTAYGTGKTSETVPTNAIQSMTPVTAGVTTPGWEQFLQGTLGGLVGYAVQKDAVKNGVAPSQMQPAPQQQAAAAAASRASMLTPILVGVGVIVAGAVVYKLVK